MADHSAAVANLEKAANLPEYGSNAANTRAAPDIRAGGPGLQSGSIQRGVFPAVMPAVEPDAKASSSSAVESTDSKEAATSSGAHDLSSDCKLDVKLKCAPMSTANELQA